MLDVLAIEITAGAVRCLRLSGLGRARTVRRYTERALPPGLVLPSPSLLNIQDEAAFARILAEALGSRPPRRARLVLPDRTVRLHILNTDAVPTGGPDLRHFLVWRLQDALPFEAREARVAYLAAPNGLPERRMAITLVAREPVLAQYERLLGTLGTGVAHVAPASCHLFNLAETEVAPAGRAVTAFLALGIESATVIISLGGVPHYARMFLGPITRLEPPNPPSTPAGRTPPPTATGELLRELALSFHHAEEEAGLAPPTRLCLAGEMGHDPSLAAALQKGLGIPCAVLFPSPPPVIRRAGRLPPEAYAVLSAALKHV